MLRSKEVLIHEDEKSMATTLSDRYDIFSLLKEKVIIYIEDFEKVKKVI
jgi:hypothetical protein